MCQGVNRFALLYKITCYHWFIKYPNRKEKLTIGRKIFYTGGSSGMQICKHSDSTFVTILRKTPQANIIIRFQDMWFGYIIYL